MERVSQRKNMYFYVFYPSELILLDVFVSTGVVLGLNSVLIVKEVVLAVGQIIGHSSVTSDARLKKVEQVNLLGETGFPVNGPFCSGWSAARKRLQRSASLIFLPSSMICFFRELSME